jgi:hypothetical protein
VTLPGPELPLGAVAPLDSPPSDDELPDDELPDELLPDDVLPCLVLPVEACCADPPDVPEVLAELPPGSPSAMTPAAAALSTAAVTVAARTRAWPRSRSATARRTSRGGGGGPAGPGEPARPGGTAGPVVAAESAGPVPPPGCAAGGMGNAGPSAGPPLDVSGVMI